MGLSGTRPRLRIRALLAGPLAALLTGGCSAGPGRVTDVGATGGTTVEGGTATMALPPAAAPNWIFPIGAPGYLASYNGALQGLLYPPLYEPVRRAGSSPWTTRATSPRSRVTATATRP